MSVLHLPSFTVDHNPFPLMSLMIIVKVPNNCNGTCQCVRCWDNRTSWTLASNPHVVGITRGPCYNSVASRLVPYPGWPENARLRTDTRIHLHMCNILYECMWEEAAAHLLCRFFCSSNSSLQMPVASLEQNTMQGESVERVLKISQDKTKFL